MAMSSFCAWCGAGHEHENACAERLLRDFVAVKQAGSGGGSFVVFSV